jgi:hypothetical protein
MSEDLVHKYLHIRRELAVTEAMLLEEYIIPSTRMASNSGIDLSKFNPDWKRGTRLTTLGRKAVIHAFESGMRQSEVARLFRLSMTRTHKLHGEWYAAQRRGSHAR